MVVVALLCIPLCYPGIRQVNAKLLVNVILDAHYQPVGRLGGDLSGPASGSMLLCYCGRR